MSVYTTNDDELCCPQCGETNVHVDGISIDPGAPVGTHVGEGLGKRVALLGYCEHCTGRFALLFVGYQGVTYLESVAQGHIGDDLVQREAS